MPAKRKRTPAGSKESRPQGRRPVWSGTLAFGLVTLPVELYSTVRSARTPLRMIGPDGTPLSRRYFSRISGDLLEDEDIVRGFEVAEDEFVTIEDEELEALDPDRSRTIDLEMFVPLEQIDPLYADNSYLVIPRAEAVSAYRLLVASMADAARAGIARFVLRERAYQLALTSVDGTLRALTLRYPDELRSAEDIGLPEPDPADLDDIAQLEAAIESLAATELDVGLLEDDSAGKLEKLVRKKLKAKKDVHRVSKDQTTEDEAEEESAPDLLEQLRQSLAGSATPQA